jgi:peptidyl-prolyl cis-trans isomerase A (cyclophilin A)
VFGKVVSGTEVVDKIRAVRTGNKGGMQDVPLESVTIQSATVAK